MWACVSVYASFGHGLCFLLKSEQFCILGQIWPQVFGKGRHLGLLCGMLGGAQRSKTHGPCPSKELAGKWGDEFSLVQDYWLQNKEMLAGWGSSIWRWVGRSWREGRVNSRGTRGAWTLTKDGAQLNFRFLRSACGLVIKHGGLFSPPPILCDEMNVGCIGLLLSCPLTSISTELGLKIWWLLLASRALWSKVNNSVRNLIK